VRHRLAEQGKIAVQQLIGMIESRRLNDVHQPAGITVLQPQLIIRKSSVVVKRGW
jgi:DNA-binding LacI/PurR family transcriptional regulator